MRYLMKQSVQFSLRGFLLFCDKLRKTGLDSFMGEHDTIIENKSVAHRVRCVCIVMNVIFIRKTGSV